MARTITIYGGLFFLAFAVALFVLLKVRDLDPSAGAPAAQVQKPPELVGAEAVQALRWQGKIRLARVKEIVAWLKTEPNLPVYQAELDAMLQLPQDNTLERAYVVLERFEMPKKVGFNEIHTLIAPDESKVPSGDLGPLEVWIMLPHKCVGCRPAVTQ